MIKFTIAGFLTDFANGERQVALDSSVTTLNAALQELWAKHVALRDRVVNERGEIRQHVNIFLNNENVRRLDSLDTEVKSGDEITILPSVSGGDESNVPGFFDAVSKGEVEAVQAMLTQHPQLVNIRYDRATPLHFAALENHGKIVDVLLNSGADLEARDDEFNMTPIGWANEKGHQQMVRYLYEKGANVNLYSAVAFGLEDRVRDLLRDDGESINEADHFGTPVHEASLWGHAAIVQMLLDHGADPELRNVHGDSALEIARKQIESNCRATPIVTQSRREKIRAGCSEVVALLEARGQKM